jgi:sugar lactone lactonase YvrE
MTSEIGIKIARYLSVGLTVCLYACGGGSATVPTAATSKPQSDYLISAEAVNPQIGDLTSKINLATSQATSKAVAGTASISIQALASSNAQKGSPELLADMVSYQRKNFSLVNPIKTDVSRNVDGRTTITVFHEAHGLRLGDKVAVKNQSAILDNTVANFNGVPVTNLSTWNYVIPVHPDRYELTVEGVANKTGFADLNVSVDYLVVDCSGKFDYLQTPLSTKPLSSSVEGFQVYSSTTTVASRLKGCSPEYYGDTKTTKYFKKNLSANYELVAQEVAGGDYSFVSGKWDLPADPLQSGDAVTEKTIGKLKNFTDKTLSYTDGYAIASFVPKKNTASSVFLFSYLRNYADNDVLLSTETDIYAPIIGDTAGSMGLIKKLIDYNNVQKTLVEIQNFIPAPDVADFAIQNGYSASDAAKIKLGCKDLLLLSCIRYYMPGVNVSFGPPPIYFLSASAATVVEGTSVAFTLATRNVSTGTLFQYTLTGSSNASRPSIAKSSGVMIVDANGNATFTLVVPANSFTNGSGSLTMSVAGQSITVMVVADTKLPPRYFPVSGSIAGLGAGKLLKISNSGSEIFSTSTNGPFAFSAPIPESAAYVVSVYAQPSGQNCTVLNASGYATGVVRNIQVNCGEIPPISYLIGGTLSGLLNGVTVTLDLNSSQSIVLSQNGPFTFSTPLTLGSIYTARVTQQPWGQLCTVANSSSVAIFEVTNLEVKCTNLIPVYMLSANSNSIAEGGTATFTLSTQNVAPGTILPYTLAGTNNAAGQSASGSLTIGLDGTATVSVPIPSNTVLSDSGRLTLTVAGKSKEIVVNDVTPVPQLVVSTFAGSGIPGFTNSDDAIASTKPLYPVSLPSWSAFMNQYAVWVDSDGRSPENVQQNIIRRVQIPSAGDYFFSGQADDRLKLYLDGQLRISANDFAGAPPNVRVNLSSGIHIVKMEVINFSGPGGYAAQITDALSGTSVWTTRDATSAVSPSDQLSVAFNGPHGIATDSSGNVYVSDLSNHAIRKISPAGIVSTLAGSGSAGQGNGLGVAASFNQPVGLALDSNSNVYVADTQNHLIRKITPSGMVSTFAGSGTHGSANGFGSAASFYFPCGIAVDSNGNVYVADEFNHAIRKIAPDGLVSTVAGSGAIGRADGQGAAASFNNPTGIAVDAAGYLYVADRDNHLIRKINPAGLVSTLAGSGVAGSINGIGAAASFNYPPRLTVDPAGNILVADAGNHLIRKVTPSGVVTTLAGTGGLGQVNGAATIATFRNPRGIAVDPFGNVYVSDTNNHLIRKISVTP